MNYKKKPSVHRNRISKVEKKTQTLCLLWFNLNELNEVKLTLTGFARVKRSGGLCLLWFDYSFNGFEQWKKFQNQVILVMNLWDFFVKKSQSRFTNFGQKSYDGSWMQRSISDLGVVRRPVVSAIQQFSIVAETCFRVLCGLDLRGCSD